MSAADGPIARVLEHFHGTRSSGTGWAARCPTEAHANGDRDPSLSIGVNPDGHVLIQCHRGCDTDSVLAAAGLSMADLFPPRETKGLGTPTATYVYETADGQPTIRVLRFVPKTFRQQHWDGSQWTWGLGGATPPIYRLPKVLAAVAAGQPVIICEGEKDVHAAERAGWVATTNAQGAGKWRRDYSKIFKGATVHVVADNDDPGRLHAQAVADQVAEYAATVHLWIPPDHKDLHDHLAAGRDVRDLGRLIPEEAPSGPSTERQLMGAALMALAGQIAAAANDPKRTSKQAMTYVRELVTGLDVPEAEITGLHELHSFISTAEEEFDWLIPGLLERMDRVVIVAPEGAGKTQMARQVAIMAAQGIHPFTFEQIPPVRTLIVDLENPPRNIRRKTRNIVRAVEMERAYETGRCWLWTQPAGIDLRSGSELKALHQVCEMTEPDLICLGPLYKSFLENGEKAETINGEVARILDNIRATFGTALWLETHAPLDTGGGRNLRPMNSGVWSRWPEFGIKLVPHPDDPTNRLLTLGRFRGDRDERDWPMAMKWGARWPWQPLWSEEEVESSIEVLKVNPPRQDRSYEADESSNVSWIHGTNAS
ncbi:AAA family ATPase [Frankia sp. R82]|uniref:AAA family ATPase n=1 Tax=Frankia sp. R82 TaxID=2950553 RepID=UPI00204362E2|nr:AAA family ATPase [Frankia sp. R82]MCM3884128.1 AAA family ATPase [Frankia sp. R82]